MTEPVTVSPGETHRDREPGLQASPASTSRDKQLYLSSLLSLHMASISWKRADGTLVPGLAFGEVGRPGLVCIQEVRVHVVDVGGAMRCMPQQHAPPAGVFKRAGVSSARTHTCSSKSSGLCGVSKSTERSPKPLSCYQRRQCTCARRAASLPVMHTHHFGVSRLL